MMPLFGKVDVHEKEAFGSNRRRIKRLKHQFIREMFLSHCYKHRHEIRNNLK